VFDFLHKVIFHAIREVVMVHRTKLCVSGNLIIFANEERVKKVFRLLT